MIRSEEEHLAHYGILRRSGRYPWGSGGTEEVRNKRNRDLLDDIAMLKKEGMTEAQIARGMGMTRNEMTARRSIAVAQQRQQNISTAERHKANGWSNVAIGRRMGYPESTIRSWLAPGAKDKADALETIANLLKKHVDEKGMIDVGKGVEHHLGVTKDRLASAVAMLKEKGYEVHNIFIPQVTNPKKYTNMRVLAKPGTTLNDVNKNRGQIKQVTNYSDDNGRSFFNIQPPISVSSKRLSVNYAEDGGSKLDGVIYVRPGVKDLAIGSNRYGQVRIAIDGTHYLKGMAIYKDDLPSGVDLVYNTNKSKSDGWKSDKNKLSKDPDNPFGAIIRQHHDPATGKVNSAMNMVGSPTKPGSGEEGQWDTWSKSLSSQMLSKQSPKLAQQQLDVTFERRRKELDEINSLTNPIVRRELLIKFADQTDSAAVHLDAANLPRQATKVLLPLSSIKPTEIYAPTMRNGERVVLIRHPHAGRFEIPELTVNNRNREGRRILGTGANNPRHDAIGIHHTVAQHLSGADFDGDTVLVIPNNRGAVKTSPALEKLKNFDPMMYKLPKDSPIPHISSDRKQKEMGKISNLITDMTIRGASNEELARAVKHSMVVIDAEKHGLDFKQSEKDNGILSLKEEYQGGKIKGARTLISRASAETRIDEVRLRSPRAGGPIDKATGKKVYVPTGRQRIERKAVIDPTTGRRVYKETGKRVPIKDKVKLLSVTEDARDLSSGTVMEGIYANHSNKLKAMANDARKEAVHIKPPETSPSAKKVYAKDVSSLVSKLRNAERNAPLERQAQLLANMQVGQIRQANPGMEDKEVKKIKQIALNKARLRTGAHRNKVDITLSEWDAIQAGAISPSTLVKILNHSDMDNVKRLAMPKYTPKMTNSKLLRAKAMLDSGYTQAEVADKLGVGLTTLKVALQ